jgi:hypothetical protein
MLLGRLAEVAAPPPARFDDELLTVAHEREIVLFIRGTLGEEKGPGYKRRAHYFAPSE